MSGIAATRVTVARRVREEREHRGYSTRELSSLAGIGSSGVWQVEHHGNPTIDTLARIAHALGCPMTALLGNPKGEEKP